MSTNETRSDENEDEAPAATKTDVNNFDDSDCLPNDAPGPDAATPKYGTVEPSTKGAEELLKQG